MSRRDEPAAGAIVDGRYVVEAVAGRGTTGVVLRVRHRDTSRVLALKLLASASGGGERFRREAQILGRLDHPLIVAVTDYGHAPEFGGRPYLVMDFVEGRALRELYQTRVERGLALEWLGAIAEAVDHSHAQGVLHRDLKPENVILCGRAGSSVPLRVLDFGLAGWREPARPTPRDGPSNGAAGARLTDASQLVGTPAYVCPEQIRGDPVGPAGDVYALGVMAYELLTGRLPFEGTVLETLEAHLDEAPPRPALSGRLADVLLTALAKDPQDRPASASAFVSELRAAHEHVRTREAERALRPRRLWVAGALAALCLAAGAWLADATWVERLELRTQDWRWGLVPAHDPDPRILLVPIDDESLARDGRPLAEWGGDLAKLATAVLEAGASAVAIDLLLPRQFGESQEFVELLARDGERVVLAALASEDGRLTGLEPIDAAVGEALGAERIEALFGLVNVARDWDGVSRRSRVAFRGSHGERVPSFARRAVSQLEPHTAEPSGEWVLIDSSLRQTGLERLAWHAALDAVQRTPERFRGRLVIVGAGWLASGDSAHSVVLSGTRATVTGLELQGLLVASQLTPTRPREAAVGVGAFVALVTAAILGAGLAIGRWHTTCFTLGVLTALYALGCLLSFTLGRQLLPLAAPGLTMSLGALMGTLANAVLQPGRKR